MRSGNHTWAATDADDVLSCLETGAILKDVERTTGRVIRVLWCDSGWLEPDEAWCGGQSQVVVIDILDTCAWPEIVPIRKAYELLRSGRWIPSSDPDPFPYAFRHVGQIRKQLQDTYRGARERNARLVHAVADSRPDCFLGSVRVRLVAEAARGHGVSDAVVRKWLRYYWQSGEDENSLWPRRRFCGAPTIEEVLKNRESLPRRRGRRPLDVDLDLKEGEVDYALTSKATQAKLREGFDEFLTEHRGKGDLVTHGKGFPWSEALGSILTKYFRVRNVIRPDRRGTPVLAAVKVRPELLPTVSHLKTAVRADERLSLIIKKLQGQKRFNLKNRIKPGDPRKLALGPGTMFQIDWMLADVYLVSRLDRLPCGRPYVYFVVDHFSRMIVGLYVTFDHPTYATACKALLNAFSDKVAFAARFGMEIKREDWPSEHLCWRLLADNGELAGFESDNLVRLEVCDLANTPPFRGDLKGLVESSFQCANMGTIRWLPGHTRGPRERCAPDQANQSMLTIFEFTRLLIDWVVNWYNPRTLSSYQYTELMVRKDPPPTVPIRLWEWGCRHIGRPRRMPYDELRMRLSTFAEATIKETGLWFEGLCFISKEKAFEEAMFRGGPSGKPVRISYDPDNTHSVFLWPDAADEIPTEVVIAEISRQYDRMTFGEVWLSLEDKGARNRIAARKAIERRSDHRLFAQNEQAKAAQDLAEKHGSLAQRNALAKISDPREERTKEAKAARSNTSTAQGDVLPSPPTRVNSASLNLLSRFKKKDTSTRNEN